MNTHIHSGKSHKHSQHDRRPSYPFSFCRCGNAAKSSHRKLGVSAGKTVTGRSFPGLFQNRKIGVQHPGSGNTERELHNLIENGSGKSYRHQVIAFLLINAPETNQRDHKKSRLLSQRCHRQHQFVQSWHPDLFQQIQKTHTLPPFILISLL